MGYEFGDAAPTPGEPDEEMKNYFRTFVLSNQCKIPGLNIYFDSCGSTVVTFEEGLQVSDGGESQFLYTEYCLDVDNTLSRTISSLSASQRAEIELSESMPNDDIFGLTIDAYQAMTGTTEAEAIHDLLMEKLDDPAIQPLLHNLLEDVEALGGEDDLHLSQVTAVELQDVMDRVVGTISQRKLS